MRTLKLLLRDLLAATWQIVGFLPISIAILCGALFIARTVSQHSPEDLRGVAFAAVLLVSIGFLGAATYGLVRRIALRVLGWEVDAEDPLDERWELSAQVGEGLADGA